MQLSSCRYINKAVGFVLLSGMSLVYLLFNLLMRKKTTAETIIYRTSQ